jgi:flagella basal body P-ring formation protein FlgA
MMLLFFRLFIDQIDASQTEESKEVPMEEETEEARFSEENENQERHKCSIEEAKKVKAPVDCEQEKVNYPLLLRRIVDYFLVVSGHDMPDYFHQLTI